MSIADRINSMASNLSSAYGRIAYLGVDLSEVDKNMQNLSTVLDTVYNDYPKVSDEGISPTLSGTKVGRLSSTLKGNTSQNTTVGKNLFSPYVYSSPSTKTGITCDYDAETQTYTFNGTCTEDNTAFRIGAKNIDFTTDLTKSVAYYISGSATGFAQAQFFDTNFNKNCNLNLLDLSSNNSVISKTSSSTFTATNIRIRFNEGSAVNNFKVKFMATDSDDTTYEPYTGCIASPNPDYPQGINVVKGNNSVTVCGNNLFNLNINIKYVNTGISSRNIGDNYAYLTSMTAWSNYAILVENNKKQQDYYMQFKMSSELGRRCGLTIYGTNVKNYASSDLTSIITILDTIQDDEIKNMGDTFNSGNYKYLLFRFWANASSTQLDTAVELKYEDIMMNEGAESISYEPYTGGIYPIYLGGNVFNSSDIEENKYIAAGTGIIYDSSVSNVSGYISVIDGLIYQLTFDYVSLLNTNSRAVCFYDPKKVFISGTTISMTNKNQTITIPSGVSYLRFAYDKNLTDINLSTDTTPIELCKIGDYQDYIYRENGNWYLYKAVGKVVFDGSETGWFKSSTTAVDRFGIQKVRAGIDFTVNLSYCSHFPIVNTLDASYPDIYINSSADNLYIDFEEYDSETTKNDFTSWLSTHNTAVYYVLATPTSTQITDTTLILQLNALYNAISYNGQTNILQTNADLPFIISASALKGV